MLCNYTNVFPKYSFFFLLSFVQYSSAMQRAFACIDAPRTFDHLHQCIWHDLMLICIRQAFLNEFSRSFNYCAFIFVCLSCEWVSRSCFVILSSKPHFLLFPECIHTSCFVSFRVQNISSFIQATFAASKASGMQSSCNLILHLHNNNNIIECVREIYWQQLVKLELDWRDKYNGWFLSVKPNCSVNVENIWFRRD